VIILLNVHASTEDKSGNTKDSFYEKLRHIFNQFPKYHMKILLADFNAEVSRGHFRPALGMRVYMRLFIIVVVVVVVVNGVRVANFST
jgi:hypothetical protein